MRQRSMKSFSYDSFAKVLDDHKQTLQTGAMICEGIIGVLYRHFSNLLMA